MKRRKFDYNLIIASMKARQHKQNKWQVLAASKLPEYYKEEIKNIKSKSTFLGAMEVALREQNDLSEVDIINNLKQYE